MQAPSNSNAHTTVVEVSKTVFMPLQQEVELEKGNNNSISRDDDGIRILFPPSFRWVGILFLEVCTRNGKIIKTVPSPNKKVRQGNAKKL